MKKVHPPTRNGNHFGSYEAISGPIKSWLVAKIEVQYLTDLDEALLTSDQGSRSSALDCKVVKKSRMKNRDKL